MYFKRFLLCFSVLLLAACSDSSTQPDANSPAPQTKPVEPAPAGDDGLTERELKAAPQVKPVVIEGDEEAAVAPDVKDEPKAESEPEPKVASKPMSKQSQPTVEETVEPERTQKEQRIIDLLPETDRFVKLDAKGNPLLPESKRWRCVMDRVGDQVWEVKTRGKDRNRRFGYLVDGSAAECGYRDCSVEAYVERVNNQQLCGRNDWRLPHRVELLRLVDYAHLEDIPSIDVRYFPNTRQGRYWSSSDFEYEVSRRWAVDFSNGFDYAHRKDRTAYVRLISGE